MKPFFRQQDDLPPVYTIYLSAILSQVPLLTQSVEQW